MTGGADELIGGKPLRKRSKVAFLASREPSYPRVAIVLRALQQHFQVISFVSESKHYPVRIVAVLGKLVWAALSGRLRDCDLMLVGFFAQPILPFVACFWRRALISDGFFSLYDTLVKDKARVGPKSFASQLSRWLDGFMLRRSHLVLTDTNAHANYFRDEFQATSANFRRVFASAEESIFANLPPRALQAGETCEVLFWGGFIPLQGVDVILHAAQRLAPDRFHLTIVGAGQTEDACRSLAAELQLENVSLLGWQELTELVELSKRAHILLGIFGTSAKAARVIPNKAFQALAQGRPLITGDSPAARELLDNKRDALLVPLGDPEALAAGICWMAENYEEAIEIGRRGYRTFVDRASPTEVTTAIEQAVSSCIKDSV